MYCTTPRKQFVKHAIENGDAALIRKQLQFNRGEALSKCNMVMSITDIVKHGECNSNRCKMLNILYTSEFSAGVRQKSIN